MLATLKIKKQQSSFSLPDLSPQIWFTKILCNNSSAVSIEHSTLAIYNLYNILVKYECHTTTLPLPDYSPVIDKNLVE